MVQDVASADQFDDRTSRLESLLARISESIGPVRCELWFGEPGSVVWNDQEVLFRVENEFSLNRVVRQHGPQLRQAVENLAGRETAVKFIVATRNPSERVSADSAPTLSGSGDTVPNQEASPAAPVLRPERGLEGEKTAAELQQVRLTVPLAGPHRMDPIDDAAGPANRTETESAEIRRLGINGVRARVQAVAPAGATTAGPNGSAGRRDRTLDSFWFGSENQLIETAVRENFQRPGHFSPLVVYGPTGSGKTHLLEGICRQFRLMYPQRRCVFLTAEQFVNEFVSCLRKSGLPMFRRKFRDLDLLAIDDIHYLAGKTATINELNVTLEQLIRDGKQIILTTDRAPLELSQISQELVARLQGGLNCPLRYPELVGRRTILETICQQRGWVFSGEVLDLIAEGIERDCRRLGGALNRLRAVELSSGKAATRESASRDLSDLMVIGEPSTTLPRIEQLVCEACGIPAAQLRSDARTKRISSARTLAMWLSRQHTSNALSEIGDFFGGRSHSTVVAAQRRVEQWMESGECIELQNGPVPIREAVQLLARRLRVG